MKNLKYFVMAMFAILASVSFSACSSDDDKDGGAAPAAALSQLLTAGRSTTSISMSFR
ncbi:hypothetical protein [Leyella stercorea]|uniref:hypothetical protein n=1 Tax=Leyella stercorea TaxID=363265 RepID=UPI003AEF5E41